MISVRVGFACLLVGFAVLAPLTVAMLGGSWVAIAASLPVAWAVGLVGVQAAARTDRDVAAIRQPGPSALLALPLGGLILAIAGLVLAASGIGL
jgi:hypothetical protein